MARYWKFFMRYGVKYVQNDTIAHALTILGGYKDKSRHVEARP